MKVLITHEGRTQNTAAWAREVGLPYLTLRDRLARGWDVAKALQTPSGVGARGKPITYNGRTQSIAAWSRELRVHYNTLHSWLTYRGLSIEDAIKAIHSGSSR